MLDKRQKYLQIALNSTLTEAEKIINQIPLDKRIIIEVGTPLIKTYGIRAIRKIRFWWEERIFGVETKTFNAFEFQSLTPYIVADLKCMDRGATEVKIASLGGANAAIALGQAPIETLDAFIKACQDYNLDAMIDMMNVEYPLNVLRQLKNLPQVVILHRGADEEAFDPESEIPYHEIHRIKENYDIMIATAGGDTFQEVQRAIFNDADIVVVWKSFYKSTTETAKLAEEFLKEIR